MYWNFCKNLNSELVIRSYELLICGFLFCELIIVGLFFEKGYNLNELIYLCKLLFVCNWRLIELGICLRYVLL